MQLSTFLSSTIPITIIIEGVLLWFWSFGSTNRKRKFPARLATLTFANILTQLILISALVWTPFPYWPTLLAMEVLIVLIEAGVLSQTSLDWHKALQLSLLVNIVSFGMGLILPY